MKPKENKAMHIDHREEDSTIHFIVEEKEYSVSMDRDGKVTCPFSSKVSSMVKLHFKACIKTKGIKETIPQNLFDKILQQKYEIKKKKEN